MEFSQIALMFAWRIVVCAVASWLVYRFVGGPPAVITVALWGIMLAKPTIELVAAWFNWARREPYAKWQGQYYEFANVQIRILARDDGLWFCAADVLQVLGEKPAVNLNTIYDGNDYRHFAEEGFAAFSERVVALVLQQSRHPEAARMWLWLQREVIKQHYRKREIAQLERQNELPIE